MHRRWLQCGWMLRGSMLSWGALPLLLASVLWGTTGTAASFFPRDVGSLAVGSATMGIGGALLFAISAGQSRAAIRNRASRPWLLLGAIGVVVYPLAFYAAMNDAGVAVGNVVALGSGPVFAAFYEWGWERHRPGRLWLACTSLAIAGVVLLAAGGSARVADPGALVVGVILGLVAGAAYALYAYASSRAISSGQSSRGVMGGMFGVGALVLLPVLLVTGAPLLQSPETVGITAYLALGPMLVAYLLFGIGIRALRSSSATTITLIEPIVATVLAVLVVGERPGPVSWIGVALVFAGAVVIASARHPDKSP